MKLFKHFSLCIALLSSGLLFSQEVWVGPKAGLNIMPIEYSRLTGNKFSLGFHVGGTVEYRFNKWFSVAADLLYTTKNKAYEKKENESAIKKVSGLLSIFGQSAASGGQIDSLMQTVSRYANDTVYSTTKGFVKLGYIEIPVMAKFRYKEFSFAAGPYVALLFSNKASEELRQDIPLLTALKPTLDTISPLITQVISGLFPAYDAPKITNEIQSNDVKMFDYGFVADITYQSSSNVTFSLRYTQGLTNYRSPEIRKNDYHSIINISIGYLFNATKSKGGSLL